MKIAVAGKFAPAFYSVSSLYEKNITIAYIGQGSCCSGSLCAGARRKIFIDSASVEHAGVPKGEVINVAFDHSSVFPGTRRDYWIYIPTQYRPDHPACVYVNQDGIQWKAPTVFDNLINSREMPVTIGVFIQPGRVSSPRYRASALDRFNAVSNTTDWVTIMCASFSTRSYPMLKNIRLVMAGQYICPVTEMTGPSADPAAALSVAFTAAWERPDAFSRVFSAIGTYVGLRGGDRYSDPYPEI